MLVEILERRVERGALNAGRNRAALIAKNSEVAVERAASILDHANAAAVAQRAAQVEDLGVEDLLGHFIVAAETARGHDDSLCHNVDVGFGLNADGLAVFHDDLLAACGVQEFATGFFNGVDDGGHAVVAAIAEEVARAEAVAVYVGPQRHGNAEVAHRVDRVGRARERVAQKLAVHARAREVVHIVEELVERQVFAFGRLQLGAACGGAAAHREVRGCGGRRFLAHDDGAARASEHERGHKACGACADNGDVAVLRFFAFLAGNFVGLFLGSLIGSCGLRLVGFRRARRHAHARCRRAGQKRATHEIASAHVHFHGFPPVIECGTRRIG